MLEFKSGNAEVVISGNFIRLTGPAIPPEHRHKIEDALKELGFEVDGGGTNFGDNLSDIFLVRHDVIKEDRYSKIGAIVITSPVETIPTEALK